jgi:hypothetical protein
MYAELIGMPSKGPTRRSGGDGQALSPLRPDPDLLKLSLQYLQVLPTFVTVTHHAAEDVLRPSNRYRQVAGMYVAARTYQSSVPTRTTHDIIPEFRPQARGNFGSRSLHDLASGMISGTVALTSTVSRKAVTYSTGLILPFSS